MVDEKQQKTEEEFRAANEVVYKHSLELVRLSQELEKANRAQESLLHFISHEVKGYLTKGQSAFAGIVEGDYGVAPPPILELAHGALAEMRKGSSTVMDILEASNLKRGSVNFVMAPFDLKKTVQDTVDELKPHAVERGLLLSLEFSMEEFVMNGDENKIRSHVLRNFIDNSIRYTKTGFIRVTLAKAGENLVFTVADSGVGLTDDDKKRLFTEGGRGAESVSVNVESTGYGLYIAKQIVDAHHGTISATSEGRNKGSVFTIILPAVQQPANPESGRSSHDDLSAPR